MPDDGGSHASFYALNGEPRGRKLASATGGWEQREAGEQPPVTGQPSGRELWGGGPGLLAASGPKGASASLAWGTKTCTSLRTKTLAFLGVLVDFLEKMFLHVLYALRTISRDFEFLLF